MRRILIDHARKRQRIKRDPGIAAPFDVLVVDQALQRMTSSFPRHAQIVQLRFFGGLDWPEIAATPGISLHRRARLALRQSLAAK